MHYQKSRLLFYSGHGCHHFISGKHEHPGAVSGLGVSPATSSLLAKIFTLCCGLLYVVGVAEGPIYFKVQS